jgi:hypothetical protein
MKLQTLTSRYVVLLIKLEAESPKPYKKFKPEMEHLLAR